MTTLLWMECGPCSGESMAILGAEGSGKGEQELTLLCIEGSIIYGPHRTGMFDTFVGKPKRNIIRALCDMADYVLAMGTCAACGGIPAAPPNPTE